MRNCIFVLLIGLSLLLAACGRSMVRETGANETSVLSDRAVSTEPSLTNGTDPDADAAQPQSPTTPEDAGALPSVRTLPGMIMSLVHVRLWDGDVAPGLRAEDEGTVKRIVAAQTWGPGYDNLSDVWIEVEGVDYAYDMQSGILTAADDRAAKLSDADRAQVNAILAEYLPGYDEERGFFAP